MEDKLTKVRAEIKRLIEQTKPYLGACAGQVVAEANSKIAAYNDVLCILDSMQKEPESYKPKITLGEATGKLKELVDNVSEEELVEVHKQLEELTKECMYSKGNYTDEDRKVLCDGCKEKCEYAQKGEEV